MHLQDNAPLYDKQFNLKSVPRYRPLFLNLQISLQKTRCFFSAMFGVIQTTSYKGFHVLILLHDICVSVQPQALEKPKKNINLLSLYKHNPESGKYS